MDKHRLYKASLDIVQEQLEPKSITLHFKVSPELTAGL